MNTARSTLPSLLTLLALLVGCSSSTRTVRVAVPPRMDLKPYPVVGIVTFSSNRNDAELERLASQKFLEQVQAAQPGTRVVELGSQQELLSSVGRSNFDPAALRAVKTKHEVDALIVGRVDVERAKPRVEVSTLWKAVSASADVNVALWARVYETQSGATMWTDSSKLTTTIAHGDFTKTSASGSIRDTETTYGRMIERMTCDITDAFREHYVLKRVPKTDAAYADVRE
jgi:hypothetical protein